MGCDIHVHVEIKHKELGWLHWNHPRVERWYRMFYKNGRSATQRRERRRANSRAARLSERCN
jgi:hypothetical protein